PAWSCGSHSSLGVLGPKIRRDKAPHAGAFGVHDRHQSGRRLVAIVVEDQVIVFLVLGELARRVLEPPLDHIGRVGVARQESVPKRFERGWTQEHRHCLRLRAPHARTSLDIHLEHYHPARADLVLDEPRGRAVEMAVHLRPLEKPPGRPASLELLATQEPVLHAVGFTGTARPRGVGDREHALAARGQQPIHEGALAHSRGPGDHEQEPGRHEPERSRGLARCRIPIPHSTFCTCSRRRSSSSLITITACAVSTSLDLEPIVFASRFISWSKKLSLRPAISGPSMSERNWSMWAASRTHSSVQSRRSARSATSWATRIGSSWTSPNNGLMRASIRSFASCGLSGARSPTR